MTEKKSNALDNVRKHFGKTTSILANFIFALSFLVWFASQLSYTTSSLVKLFHFDHDWHLSLLLGGLVSLLSLGGFRMLKWTCVLGLPILIYFSIHNLISCNETIWNNYNNFNITQVYYSAIPPVLMAFLSGTVGLPTFFRNSRSLEDSKLALALILVVHVFLQISTIFYGTDFLILSNENSIKGLFHLITTTAVVLISFICVNMINIYFASACWELINHEKYEHTKYITFGVLGTCFYGIMKYYNNMKDFFILENIINFSMIILLISLLVHFLIFRVAKHRSPPLNKFFGSLSWLVGSGAIIILIFYYPEDPNKAFTAGLVTTILFSIIIIFFEIFLWSLRNLKKNES